MLLANFFRLDLLGHMILCKKSHHHLMQDGSSTSQLFQLEKRSDESGV